MCLDILISVCVVVERLRVFVRTKWAYKREQNTADPVTHGRQEHRGRDHQI
jgi:hypothetical protein